jgi:biofilm PGA synthesis protein PgaA
VSAVYARNESANVRAHLKYQDFSDQNTGTSFLLLAQQKLYGGPRFRLALNGEAGIDNHKLDNVSYFSPKRSRTLAAGLRFDWMMMRRYDFGLTHTLSGMKGRYDQSGFEADDIWTFSYLFQADLNDRLNLNIGISRRSNVYDGSREYATFLLGGVQWKF